MAHQIAAFPPLAMMAEVRRTATGQDPAARWSVFRNMGTTYLYKVLPDGSEAYTRNGSFDVTANGVLQTRAGHSVMGDGGPIAIPADTLLEIQTAIDAGFVRAVSLI